MPGKLEWSADAGGGDDVVGNISQFPGSGARGAAVVATSDISMSIFGQAPFSSEAWVELQSSDFVAGPVTCGLKLGVAGVGMDGVEWAEPTVAGGGGVNCAVEFYRIQLWSLRNRGSSRGGLP